MTHDPTSAPAGRKPKGTSPERRQEILAHALALFCEYGVHRVSTRQIARAVGISQPSLYAHFPNRQAIVNEVCEGAFARLTTRMQAVLRPAHGPEVIQDLARVYIEFGLAEPDAYRVAFMIEPIGSGLTFVVLAPVDVTVSPLSAKAAPADPAAPTNESRMASPKRFQNLVSITPATPIRP